MEADERKLTWLAGFSHFITHGYMTLLPAVLIVITAEHSLSFTEIGLIANIGYFLYGLGSFPAGYLSDKFGSKRMLTIGVGGMAVSSILVGLTPGATAFAVTYAMLGLFASIHHPAGLSLIARRVNTRRGKALGLHGVMGNVGLFLTPLVASYGVKFFGTWRAAYIIYGMLGLLFAAVLHMTKLKDEADLNWRKLFRRTAPRPVVSGRDESPPAPAAGEAGPGKSAALIVVPISLLLLYLGSVLSGFIFRGSLTFFPTLLQSEVHFINIHDEPVYMAGVVTTAVLSLGLIGAWFGGYINDKIKKPEFLPFYIFIVVAPVLYLISSLVDAKLLLFSCLFSLVYYAWQPAQNYLVAKYTKKASHGMGFGINFFLIFGVGSIATATGGYVTDEYGVDRFYLLLSYIGGAACFVALGVYLARAYLLKFTWRLVRDE
ncbi:MAG: MFS transporter [Desulfurivibrionaceae bacterium]|nr:MFS transporter [Desulfobulbales bacterium]MDT8335251.1 MFS transporter [Desulfurivibrionaceae bacterium]